MVIKVLALLFLAMHLLATVALADTIGEPRKPLTPKHLLVFFAFDVWVAAMVGRLWGWW